MSARLRLAAAVVVFLGLIVGANALTAALGFVPIGFGLTVTAGTFAAGLALSAREWVHVAGGRGLVLAVISAGALLSVAVSSPELALASGLAFLCGELADMAVFVRLRAASLVAALLVSNAVGALIDTLVFLPVAGFDVTWQVVAGQLLVKAGACSVVALGLWGGARALLRQPQHA